MMLRNAVIAAAMMFSIPSYADGRWAMFHPRRDQVNDRLANQNARIRDGVRDGQLSRGEAHQLHREDRTIRAEERAMAAEHGGHITKGEQRQLNRQENQVSRQIHAERRGR